VLVGFADKVAYGASLGEALNKVFNGDAGAGTTDPGKTTPPPSANPTVKQALAEAQQAYAAAQAALKKGDLAGYQANVDKMMAAVNRANAGTVATPTPKPSGTPSSPPPSTPPPSTPPSSPTG
jgi:uncharacterized membrane protein (UPF0182 family)